MDTLTVTAQKHIERVMQELSGDEDFMPFMTIRNHNGDIVYVGLLMPPDDESRTELADVMTALCMVHRSIEATFASVVWSVTCNKPPDVMPSEHPDRREEVFLLVMDAEKHCTTHSAPVIRENNMIGVGLWESQENIEAWGRFGEAIRIGISMGQSLPPDLCEWMDQQATSADNMEALVRRTATLLTQTRKGLFGK